MKIKDILETWQDIEAEQAQQKVFRVHVPANIYAGKYYDYRTVGVYVAAQTEDEAIQIVNAHRSKALDMIAVKRMRSGQRTLPYVKTPADKNVFFKDDYATDPMSGGSVNALTKSGQVLRFQGENGVWRAEGNLRDPRFINYRDSL